MDLLLQVSENLYINLEANNYDTPSSVMKNVLYGYRLVLSKQATGKNYIPIEFIQLNFDDCSLHFNKKIVNRFVTQEEDLKIRHPYMGKTIQDKRMRNCAFFVLIYKYRIKLVVI